MDDYNFTCAQYRGWLKFQVCPISWLIGVLSTPSIIVVDWLIQVGMPNVMVDYISKYAQSHG